MIRSPMAFLLAIFMILVLAGCTGQEAYEFAPQSAFDKTEIDLGDLQANQPMRAVFSLENRGDLPLLVNELRAGCGLTAGVSPNPIAARSTGRITISAFAGLEPGPQAMSVTVYTNDPAHPVTSLVLRSRVQTDLAASPARFYLGNIRPGDTSPFTIGLSGTINLVERVETTARPLYAELFERAGQMRIRLGIRGDALPGPLKEQILVYIRGRKEPRLVIPILGEVVR